MISPQADLGEPQVAYFQGRTAIVTVSEQSWLEPVRGMLTKLEGILSELPASLITVVPATFLRNPARAKFLPRCFEVIATSDQTNMMIVRFGNEIMPVFRKGVWSRYSQFGIPSEVVAVREYFSGMFADTQLRREVGSAEIFAETK